MHDRWAAAGATTLADRIRARVAQLRAEPRGFILSAAHRGRLEAILGEALDDCGARV